MAVAKNSNITSLKQLRGKLLLKTGTAAANYALSLKDKYGFKTVTFEILTHTMLLTETLLLVLKICL